MSDLKRVFSILLCFFILLQSGILSFQYYCQIIRHKKAVERDIEKGVFDSELIAFTSYELEYAEWENDHEFFLNDEKYDVVKVFTKYGETRYACINDKAEETLIKNLGKSEEKSTLIEKFLKNINIQFYSLFDLNIPSIEYEGTTGVSYIQSAYSYMFLRLIIKPPAF